MVPMNCLESLFFFHCSEVLWKVLNIFTFICMKFHEIYFNIQIIDTYIFYEGMGKLKHISSLSVVVCSDLKFQLF